MRYQFHAEQWIAAPIGPIFAFFANPHNIHHISPPDQKVRVEDASFVPPPPHPNSPRTPLAGAGSHVTLSFRPVPHLFLRLFWELDVIEFDWNARFTDQQTHGPFGYWRHMHSFATETRETEGTLLSDDIDYQMPAGALGTMVQPLVEQQLKAMFEYRHKKLEELWKKHAR